MLNDFAVSYEELKLPIEPDPLQLYSNSAKLARSYLANIVNTNSNFIIIDVSSGRRILTVVAVQAALLLNGLFYEYYSKINLTSSIFGVVSRPTIKEVDSLAVKQSESIPINTSIVLLHKLHGFAHVLKKKDFDNFINFYKIIKDQDIDDKRFSQNNFAKLMHISPSKLSNLKKTLIQAQIFDETNFSLTHFGDEYYKLLKELKATEKNFSIKDTIIMKYQQSSMTFQEIVKII